MSSRRPWGPKGIVALGFGGALAAAACGGPQEGPAPMLVADPPPSEDGAPGAGMADFDRGVAYIKQEAFEKAIPHFDEVLEANPKHAQAEYYRAVARERLGQRDQAAEGYRRALVLEPTLVEAAVNLGALYLDEGGEPPRKAQPDKAIAVLRKAVEQVPDDPDIKENLAFAYRLKKNYAKAGELYQAALKLGESARLRFAYGDMLFEQKKCEPASAQLEKASAGFEQDFRTLVTIADLLGHCKAFAGCVRALNAALKLEASDPQWYVRRGLCHHGAKDEPKARSDFETALKKDPKFAAAHFYLGMSWLAEKNRLKASRAFRKAVKLDPKGPIGKKAKEQLDDLGRRQRQGR